MSAKASKFHLDHFVLCFAFFLFFVFGNTLPHPKPLPYHLRMLLSSGPCPQAMAVMVMSMNTSDTGKLPFRPPALDDFPMEKETGTESDMIHIV